MYKKQHIDFKEGVNNLDLLFISPWLLVILADMSLWCHINDLPFKVTSMIRTKEQDAKLQAKSKTHQEFRAFDLSLHDWDYENIKAFEHVFSKKYEHYAAISSSTLQPRLIYIHDNGNGRHAHIQVKRGLK